MTKAVMHCKSRHAIAKPSVLWRLISVVCMLMVLGNMPAMAETVKYPKPGNMLSRGLQGVLGLNRLGGWIAGQQIEKAIRKKVAGDVDVRVVPYSAIDLARGLAKRLEIRGNRLWIDQTLSISRFELSTDQDTPLWVDIKEGRLNAPVDADFRLVVSETDINKTLLAPKIQQKLSAIKVPLAGAGTQVLSLIQPRVTLLPNMLRFQTQVNVQNNPLEKALPIQLETGLAAEAQTGRMRLTFLSLAPIPGVSTDITALTDEAKRAIEAVLDPAKLLPADKMALQIQSIQVVQGGIEMTGRLQVQPMDL